MYYNKALNYFIIKKDTENLAKIYQDLSSLEFKLKNNIKAESFLLKKLDLMLAEKDSIEIAKSYYLLGRFNRKLNKPKKAINYLNKAKEIFSRTGFPNNDYKQKFYTNNAMTYNSLKDYKNAYKYLRKSYLLKDSIQRNRSRALAIEMEAKYQNKEKKQKIELLSQEKQKQKIVLLSGIVLTSLIGLFFFFQYKNRQKITKKLKEVDKAKSIFFANISHEFRTPLTLISGPIQKQLSKNNLQENQREDFEMMHRNTNRFISLVEQLLDISKMASGNLKLKVSNSNIITFVATLVESFNFMAKQKELNYLINNNTTELDSWYDKDFIEKIILNLVSNAIKYTPKKGTVICDASVVDNYFVFKIKNSGKGLTKQELKKIFNRFYQIDEYQQGTGIGLSLAKDLVELHKGKITVESELNNWTIFTIKIPINKNAFKDFEIINNKPTTTLALNVESKYVDAFESDLENNEYPILLLVEDNAEVRSYIYSIFKNDYQVLQAKNGQEGIDLAIENIPDIIISDIMMPLKNGIELCNTLKADERTSHIPIILLTAKSGDENKLEGVKSGADDYITKPFNEELLKLKTTNLFKIRKKLQDRFSQEVILKPVDISISSVDELFLDKIQVILDTKIIESDFNAVEFCNIIGVSRMQLHRKLKALFNMSTTEFIRSQRLKLAADLLKKSDINISQIGYSVGFNDHAYFSKRFKEQFGCTPLEFSKKQ